MDRQILNFTANEQILVCDNPIKISTNKVNYIEARFDLGTNWSGYDSVRAVWFNDFQCISTVLDFQGVTSVPFEVMKRKGNVKVNLVGSISENDVLTDRLTSYPVVAVVVDCIAQITGANTSPITPSEYEQFVASVRNDADRAEQGASDAETYANNAQGYAQNASESATSAENYASDAEDARDEIRNMSANATTLPAGSSATASYSDGVLSLGIPQGIQGEKGDNGDTGATPNLTIGTVETLEPTESATATITGTDENPVLNLGLPKGEQGEVSLDELLQNTIVQTNSDSVPYNFRPTPSCGSLEYDEIVGASVAWNQLVQTEYKSGTTTPDGTATYSLNAFSCPVIANHVYAISVDIKYDGSKFPLRPYSQIGYSNVYGKPSIDITSNATKECLWLVKPTANNPTVNIGISNITTSEKLTSADVWSRDNKMVSDLTLALGSTIADYVYSLETATAGAGVAWLKSHFDCFNSYQPFNSGSIESVNGLEAHVMKDSSDNIIGNYPLDSTLTLRGIYKMDADHNLYADGDVYKADGTVTRKYGVVDLGSLSWIKLTASEWDCFYTVDIPKAYGYNLVCSKYARSTVYGTSTDKIMDGNTGSSAFYIRDTAYTSASDFKTAMNGVYLVYELATPTTESADPYTNPQLSYDGGTEEYVSDCIVPIGHSTNYPMTLGDTMPKANGTYTMSVTIANGKKTINWT